MTKFSALNFPKLPFGDWPDPLLPGLLFVVKHRHRYWSSASAATASDHVNASGSGR